MMEPQKNKTLFDRYERVVDNLLRILWVILLITWIVGEHKITIN